MDRLPSTCFCLSGPSYLVSSSQFRSNSEEVVLIPSPQTWGALTPRRSCAVSFSSHWAPPGHRVSFSLTKAVRLSFSFHLSLILTPDVLTSGHVFKELLLDPRAGFAPRFGPNAPPLRIRIGFDWHAAELLYVSPNYVDFAILRMDPVPGLRSISFFTAPLPTSYPEPRVGEPVFVLGHGLFAPHQRPLSSPTSAYLLLILSSGLPPSVSRGVVSKIVYHKGQPLIVETDAHVHSGASGGLLISAHSGSFLGLVTSNTQSHQGVLYTRINSSVPALFLHEALRRFLDADKGALSSPFVPLTP